MCNLPSLPMVRTRCLCISHMAYRESRHDIIIVFHGHRRRRLRTLEGASHGFTVRCQGDPGVDAHTRQSRLRTHHHRPARADDPGRVPRRGRPWAVSADETTRNNEMLVSIALVAWTSALLGLPKDLANLNGRALAGRAGLRDSQPLELLRSGRVGRVWHPAGLP